MSKLLTWQQARLEELPNTVALSLFSYFSQCHPRFVFLKFAGCLFSQLYTFDLAIFHRTM